MTAANPAQSAYTKAQADIIGDPGAGLIHQDRAQQIDNLGAGRHLVG